MRLLPALLSASSAIGVPIPRETIGPLTTYWVCMRLDSGVVVFDAEAPPTAARRVAEERAQAVWKDGGTWVWGLDWDAHGRPVSPDELVDVWVHELAPSLGVVCGGGAR